MAFLTEPDISGGDEIKASHMLYVQLVKREEFKHSSWAEFGCVIFKK